MEEEEAALLECNTTPGVCAPAQGSSPAPAAPQMQHLDDAAGELAGPPHRASGATIGPTTGALGPVRRHRSTVAREAARRNASDDAFDMRVGEQGPYVYGEHEAGTGTTPGSFTFGAGLAHNPSGDGVEGDFMSVHGGAGRWRNQDGEEYEGIRLHGGALSGSADQQEGNLNTIGLGVGTFDAGVYTTDETFSAGIQGNLGEVSGTVGTRTPDRESNTDTTLRGGFSAGGGFGVRAHYGDADEDGARERGIGADLGPVSFDLQSEYLGRAYDAVFGD